MDSVATVASPTISEETGKSKRAVHGWASQSNNEDDKFLKKKQVMLLSFVDSDIASNCDPNQARNCMMVDKVVG
jgi:hypothetical protein